MRVEICIINIVRYTTFTFHLHESSYGWRNGNMTGWQTLVTNEASILLFSASARTAVVCLSVRVGGSRTALYHMQSHVALRASNAIPECPSHLLIINAVYSSNQYSYRRVDSFTADVAPALAPSLYRDQSVVIWRSRRKVTCTVGSSVGLCFNTEPSRLTWPSYFKPDSRIYGRSQSWESHHDPFQGGSVFESRIFWDVYHYIM
jgi:hypothetical protein